MTEPVNVKRTRANDRRGGAAVSRSLPRLAAALFVAWWPQMIALAAACGVVAVTIVGAVGVGDCLRQGLRSLAERRLGGITAAVVSRDLFRAVVAGEMAGRLATSPEPTAWGSDGTSPALHPALLVEVTVERPDASGRQGGVIATLLACDAPHQLGYAGPPAAIGLDPTTGREQVSINATLAMAINAQAGDVIVVRFAERSAVPADLALGRRTTETVGRRLRVGAVLPGGSIGDFSIRPTQVTEALLITTLDTGQQLLGRGPVANAILAVPAGDPKQADVAAITQRLSASLRPSLADYGLRFATGPESVAGGPAVARLTSERLLLPPAVDRAAAAVFAGRGGAASLVLLANAMRPVDAIGSAQVPYSTVVGVDRTSLPVGQLVDAEGKPLPLPGPDEIIIDAWMADDLATQGTPVVLGMPLELAFYRPETLHGRVEEVRRIFRVSGIAAMHGPAVERSFVPEVEGITDEASIADWDPPFPFDRDRVRTTPPDDADDRYWKAYGATPKAFLALDTARELAASRFGRSTAWHVPVADQADMEMLGGQLAASLDPASMGFRVIPMAMTALAAARGSTPFGGLFLGLSSFVVVAGLLLVRLLFQLLVSARRREIGILAAIGWPPRRLAALLLWLGGWAAAAGGLCGALLGPFWSALLVSRLARSWEMTVAAGSQAVFEVVLPDWRMVVVVAMAAMVVALLALARASSRAARSSPADLLHDRHERPALRSLAWLQTPQGAWWKEQPVRSLAGLAVRGLSSRRSRTLLVAAMVAVAEFLIVFVSGFTLRDPIDPHRIDGPTGGWDYLVRFGSPSAVDPQDPETTAEVGLSERAQQTLAGCQISRLRTSGGEDASCTNLYATTVPTVLGLNGALIRRGGFRFVSHIPLTGRAAEAANPWLLLEDATGPQGGVPVILDAATAQWALKLGGLGATFRLPAVERPADGTGNLADTTDEGPLLEIVGLLEPGILQGHVLMAEDAFVRLFPRVSGYGLALVAEPADADQAAAGSVPAAVRDLWADVGVAIEPTLDRLRSLYAVQNTFLAGFQALGTLGLLLGTAGVGAVQLQGVWERRGGLALLRAIGFSLPRIRLLLLLETVLTVAAGLAAGGTIGLLAMLPLATGGRLGVPWFWLAASIGGTLSAAVAASLLASLGRSIPLRPGRS